MNLKELHNPTFRQEDNRLYLVGYPTKEPKEKDFATINGIYWGQWKQAHNKWLQSEVKYPVRERDENKLLELSGLIVFDLESKFSHADLLNKGIPVPPELMERLVLSESKTDFKACVDCPYNCHPCPEGCSKSNFEIALKEEPKGESEDEMYVNVYKDKFGDINVGNIQSSIESADDACDDLVDRIGLYKLVKVK